MRLKHILTLFKAMCSDDVMLRLDVLRRVARFILSQYRFMWPQIAWWDDRQFNDYLRRFDELSGMNTDRRWMLYQLMRLVTSVPGDSAECGTARKFSRAAKYLWR